MTGWLISSTPWWVWVLIAAVLLAVFSQTLIPLWLALPATVRKVIIGIATLGLVFLAGRNRGKSDADNMQKQRDAKADRILKEKKDEIGNLDDAALRKRADRWMRD